MRCVVNILENFTKRKFKKITNKAIETVKHIRDDGKTLYNQYSLHVISLRRMGLKTKAAKTAALKT